MSQNAGLDMGKPEFNVFQKEPIMVKDRTGVLRPSQQKVGYEDKFDNQNTIKDSRYSPFQRGKMNRKNYRRSEKMVDKEKCVKKDPFKQAVSFIPRTKILMEQPAVNNSAAPNYVRLDYNPVREIPDQTVCNNISEIRNVRRSNKKLLSMLDTRAQARRRVRQTMWDITPDQARIVNVKRHRENINKATILSNLAAQKTILSTMPSFQNVNLAQSITGN